VYTPHPITYLSVCVPGFPNWFQALGPNSAFGSGSQLVVIERQIEYAIKATSKLQREGLKSIEVKKEAAQDYDEYIEVRSLYRNATYDLQTHYFPLALFPDGQCYLHNSALAASHLFTLQTVYSEKCRSWYKMGKDEGHVTGLWPGA
jgi:hypothetical protein